MILDRTFDRWPGRVVRGLRRRYNDECVTILTYHSISCEPSLFTAARGLRHDPEDFEREIDYLARHYHVISMRELVESLERGEKARRAVVLTFDDGYADCLSKAMPILYRRRLPMTVFPVTSTIGNRDLLWQHKLAWLESEGHADPVWSLLKKHGWTNQNHGDTLHDYVRQNYTAAIPLLLEDALKSIGTSGPELAFEHKLYVSPEDMARTDPDFVEFGNHTDTHPVLSALSTARQMAEIGIARRRLQEITGRPPIAFAYPFGLKRHYDDTTRRLAVETGHRAIVDMRRRVNAGVVDPRDLSRKPAPCESQLEFEKMIESWPANAQVLRPEEPRDAEV